MDWRRGWTGHRLGVGSLDRRRRDDPPRLGDAYPTFVMTRTLITIVFAGGGPLDGEQLVIDEELHTWYRAEGGYYVLTRYHEAATNAGGREGVASYDWQVAAPRE